MGFPFETKVLCKLLFVMFLLILAYRLTTSLHHSQQHVDTVSTGALNTRERELEAGCCPTKQHLATARLASPCADMTQLNISSFDESASVFSLTPPFVKNTILQMFLGSCLPFKPSSQWRWKCPRYPSFSPCSHSTSSLQYFISLQEVHQNDFSYLQLFWTEG